MSIIILTPPPPPPPGGRTADTPTGAPPPQPYDEARELINRAEIAGMRVRIIEDE